MMGDCNFSYNCPKNCKYSYSTWCPTCEKNSPRRRSRSETNEPRTECRRRCKEMKTLTPKKYAKCQEYENMELEYGLKDSRTDCCRIRSNLCELPTSYIANNCQRTKTCYADVNHISMPREQKLSPSKAELIKPHYRTEQRLTPPKPKSPYHLKGEYYRDNHLADEYRNCREYCTLGDLKMHNVEDRNLCYDTGTYFDNREVDNGNLHEKYNSEVECLREKLLSLRNSSFNTETIANGLTKTAIDNLRDRVNIYSECENLAETQPKKIVSTTLPRTRNKVVLKTRVNSGRFVSTKLRKNKPKPVSNVPSSASLNERSRLIKTDRNLDSTVDKLKQLIYKRQKNCEKQKKIGPLFVQRMPVVVKEVKRRERKEIEKYVESVQNSKKDGGSSVCAESDHDYSGSDESEPDLDDGETESVSEPSTETDETKNGDERALICSSQTGAGDATIDWPIRHSLFPNIPPYISFTAHNSEFPLKFPKSSRLFKWKLTTITPILVRQTLTNSGFSLVRKSNQWLGTWGKHMKSPMFKTLKDSQKINHFPGTFQLGRKDRLWRNFQRLINKYGQKEFGFLPHTYVLPQELKLLKQNWEFKNGSGGEMWIIKPPASARGVGIKVINKWSQLPKKMPLVVQKYVSNPYLINGSKFDLRLYVLVTSFNPLRIYLYPDGLARFASAKYSDDSKDLKDRYRHLTNYSINKLSDQYTANEDANSCQGHKWTITKLMEYLQERGVNTKTLWKNLQQLVIKTMISAEAPISQLCEENMNSIYNCYELFGVDVLLDEDLKPWLLEVNISPSLHSASPLDAHVKGPLVHTLLDMVQFHLPVKIAQTTRDSPNCFDSKIYTTGLTKKERAKHLNFQQFEGRGDYLLDILADLTGDDVRHLCRAEDEYAAKGKFERIFPTQNTYKYLDFMEVRYYNRLFDAWETKYSHRRQEGIDMLKTLCGQKVHLKVASTSSLKKNSLSTIPGDAKLQPSKEGQSRPLEEILKQATITNDVVLSIN